MEEILAKSPLVPDIMLPAWDKALYLLEGEKYGLCLTLLFPLLECSLRCLYAQVNNMFERVITAENSSYYTTIDEILQLYLENDNACSKSRLSKCHENEDDEHLANASSQSELLFKSEKSRLKTSGRAYLTFNLVPFYIGRHINEMLHDMLNYVNGPRIRDRLSHGEVDVFDVPKWMTHSMMYVSCLLLCLGNWKKKREIYTEKQYLLQKRCLTNISTSLEANDHPVSQFCPEMVSAMNNTENAELYDAKFLNYLNIINLSSDATTFINKAKKYIRNYRCAYHPSALLLGKLISCLHKLKKWTSWDRTCSDDLSYTHWENISFMKLPEILTYCCDAPYHKVILLNDIQEFIHSVECTSCDVLYKPKCELELLSLLSRILHNTELALTNIKENLTLKYFQYKSNKLRSRQRETYTRQLNSVPVIVLNLYISCQCVYSVFISVNHILQSDAPTLSRLLKVFKQILKQIENTVSQTSAKCNRWDEAFISSENNIQYITNIFGKRNEDICP
ncbi:hypothetical protein SK128_017783 [Halocaridina rubra]|uniref:Uncharacterized protein n=1 Tax=Halocaridina rubra TaxID=373956 RepID=A0AAN8WKF2_HALRR